LDVSENSGFPPKSSILIGFSIINHPFWGTPIFGNTRILGEMIQFDELFFFRWVETNQPPTRCYEKIIEYTQPISIAVSGSLNRW